jgi:hypothetical protein
VVKVTLADQVTVLLPFTAYAVLFLDSKFDVVWYYEEQVFEFWCVYASFDRVLYVFGHAVDCQVD